MSLFKCREWWSATCGASDDQNNNSCLCIANIDNSPDELNKIVVGNHSGVVHIFLPSSKTKTDNNVNNSQAQSILLESQLPFPILQLKAGKFVSSSDAIYLAVLHPRKLVVYGVSYISGNVAHGWQYQMIVIYEHNLERSAYRMVTGSFGKVAGRDFICVMSLDGTISIFEQESYTFSRFLPGALLPGPVTYNSKTDSFLLVSSSCQLENYKYQGLALASSSKNIDTGQKLVADWYFILGEASLDLSVIIPKSGPSLIYVLGERHVFCFRDNGSLKFSKKLEFHPSCFHVYLNNDDADIFYIITSHTGMAMVYHDVTLKWATQVPLIPVHISRINLPDFEGGLVLLTEDGHVSCVYLGTNPANYSVFPNKVRPLNLDETNKELEKLNKIIKASQKLGTSLTNKSDALLHVTAIIDNKVSPTVTGDESFGKVPRFNLHVTIKTSSPVHNVQLTCYVDKSFIVSKSCFHFPLIAEITSFNIGVGLREGFIPSQLEAFVITCYSNIQGTTEVIQTVAHLPLNLSVAACSPTKDAEHKITICVNKALVRLDDLFPDFVEGGESNAGQAIGFQYYGGPTVTILMAKTSQRYRLQSDNFESMALILDELLKRLDKWSSGAKNHEKFICSFQNEIPLQEFYLVANTHLQNRNRFEMYSKRISQLASQIRAIQKRLLLKFKDKAATSLSNLDNLLDLTFTQMSNFATSMETHRTVLERSLRSVIAGSKLICLLLKLYTNMSDVEYVLLSKVMCSNIDDEYEQGWEEVVTAGLETLNQTTFCRSNTEGSTLDVKLKMPENLDYLKKQLNSVIEFISRGNLTEESEEQIKINSTENEEPERILIGSQFGERILIGKLPSTASQKQEETIEELISTTILDNKENAFNMEYIKKNPNIIESYGKLPEIQTAAIGANDFLEEF